MANLKNRYKPIDNRVLEMSSKYHKMPDAVLEILKDIMAENGILTKEVINDVARSLGIPAERAYGVASFYSMLGLTEQTKLVTNNKIIRVCDGPVCWLKNAKNVREKIDQEIGNNPEWVVERSSCLGLCDRAPAALVGDEQAGPVAEDEVTGIFQAWRGEPTDYSTPRIGELRVMMAKAGIVDPDAIESALNNGAYCGLNKALQSNPHHALVEIEKSGLTGRGGAGFPVGRKWGFVAQSSRMPKYIICNADESEPLIFKDRVLIDTNPHQILEGMAIAGYATGATEAYIYIRGEYEHQALRLERAIKQAEEYGWLGNYINGTDFSFKIHVHRGAGAYICGEETALIESLEGKRGEPRLRPPYPPTYGYKGFPTLVNNVESFAAVPMILCNGADWYRSLSSWTTPGTKMYMVLGHVNQPGLFEAPFGITLRDVIEKFGGGMRPGSTFNFALTGGAAGTIVPASLLDIPIDYTSASKGVSLGAGSFLICDQTISPVTFLREILYFFTNESCGKCTPCREGTRRSLVVLDSAVQGVHSIEDIDELLNLAEVMQSTSFCGLGQSVAIPMKSALTHFSDHFNGHDKT